MDKALNNMTYRLNRLSQKINKDGWKLGLLIDCLQAKRLYEYLSQENRLPHIDMVVFKGMSPFFCNNGAFCSFDDSDWIEEIHILAAIRLFEKNSDNVYELYSDIRKKTHRIVFYDQVMGDYYIWPDENPTVYKFRNLLYTITKGTVIPSYYSNNEYVDILINYIKKNGCRSMLDMCAGSGCIGLSCMTEGTIIEELVCVDISPNAIESIEQTIARESIPNATAIHSDCFSNLPRGMSFDLIVSNPPHSNGPRLTDEDKAGYDPGWEFHKKFFLNLHNYLKPNGISIIIENGLDECSCVDDFQGLIKEENANVEIVKCDKICATEWYLLYLKPI